jgi:hypothetical protein
VSRGKAKDSQWDDILLAMNTLDFGNYAEVLKIYLEKYRDVGTNVRYLTVQKSQRARDRNRPDGHSLGSASVDRPINEALVTSLPVEAQTSSIPG